MDAGEIFGVVLGSIFVVLFSIMLVIRRRHYKVLEYRRRCNVKIRELSEAANKYHADGNDDRARMELRRAWRLSASVDIALMNGVIPKSALDPDDV